MNPLLMASIWLRRLATLAIVSVITVASVGCGVAPTNSTESETKGDALSVPTAKRVNGSVLQEVVAAPGMQTITIPSALSSGFTPQTRLGYTAGQQWEPAIAADQFGHVYVLYPQYRGVPGCATCPSPTMILIISNDSGATFSDPKQISANPGTGQWDPQIVVDPADGKTVYASWLQNNKSDTVVAKSTDFGATWTSVVADSTKAGTDKPILTVRGIDVYVGFNHAQKVWVAASHDAGKTFTSYDVNPNGKLGWSLAGGATIDSKGVVYFGWAGYKQNGGANGPVTLYVSKSSNGGKTWTNTQVGVSGAPPNCSAFSCGWAFLGAQVTLASDTKDTIYALWNAGTVDKGAERIWFSKLLSGVNAWTKANEVSTAPAGTSHAFPAITASGDGDVRISWMDTRGGTLWNTYYRSSLDGGTKWTNETRISVPASANTGLSYVTANGFTFPYGDYYEMDIDNAGNTHVIWGEGESYRGAGSIWYAKGK